MVVPYFKWGFIIFGRRWAYTKDFGPKDKQDFESYWLHSKKPEKVQTVLGSRFHETIDDVLRVIAPDFSPEECAEIVIASLKKVVENPNFKENAISFVKVVQSANEQYE